jgi:predicted nucleic acid-binding protein
MNLDRLITQLSDEIMIPEEVMEEINAGPKDDPAILWLKQNGLNYVKPPIPLSTSIAAWDLGKGETAVLNWGYQNRTWEVVVDDKAARKCAKVLGINYLGTIGIIVRAKKHGLIEQAKPLLQELPKYGFYIDSLTTNKAIHLAGEGE